MVKNKEDFRNSEYWEDRIANETWKTYNSAEEKNRALIEMYEKTSKAIKHELYALAESAEENGSLTRTQRYRFNKLLGNQGVIFQELEKLGDKVEKHGKDTMLNAGKSVYKNIMDEIGIEDFDYPNKKLIEQMMRNPWHGSFFSERLWGDMDKLQRNLNGIINDGIATGKTVTEMAVQLSNIMNKDFNYAHMLVRSETINHMNRTTLKGYKDAGIKTVEWWAAKDERTCKICGSHHTEKYDIDKTPNLPCHPGCRCTWLPVIEVDKILKATSETDKSNSKVLSTAEYKKSEKSQMLDGFIKEYSKAGIEYAMILTTANKATLIKGNEFTVDIGLCDELKDAHVIHNHAPDITHFSFSGADVQMFLEEKLSALEGTDFKYRYIIETREDTVYSGIEQIANDFDGKYFYEILEESDLNISDEEIYHKTVEKLAKIYKFNYKRVKK